MFLFYKSGSCIHCDPSKKVPQGLHILSAPITAEMRGWKTQPDISLVIALSAGARSRQRWPATQEPVWRDRDCADQRQKINPA